MMQAGGDQGPRADPVDEGLEKLFKQSPGMFSSGYFVLAAVAGAPRLGPQRRHVRGQPATAAAPPARSSSSPSTRQRPADRGAEAPPGQRRPDLRQAHNAQVAVGGPAGNLGDLTSVDQVQDLARRRGPRGRDHAGAGARAAGGALPIVATAFSLLVAAATFGVLELLFGGSTRRSAVRATWIR